MGERAVRNASIGCTVVVAAVSVSAALLLLTGLGPGPAASAALGKQLAAAHAFVGLLAACSIAWPMRPREHLLMAAAAAWYAPTAVIHFASGYYGVALAASAMAACSFWGSSRTAEWQRYHAR